MDAAALESPDRRGVEAGGGGELRLGEAGGAAPFGEGVRGHNPEQEWGLIGLRTKSSENVRCMS